MSRPSADRTVATKKEQRDRNNTSNDNDVDPRVFFPSPRRRHTVGHFGSLNSLRRDFKCPCRDKPKPVSKPQCNVALVAAAAVEEFSARHPFDPVQRKAGLTFRGELDPR